MPVTSTLTTLSRPGLDALSDYLRAVKSGDCEPADQIVVPVGLGGVVVADEVLDAALGYGADEVVSASLLTGQAGQTATAVARVGQTTMRVVFLGVGDRSAPALRRAGGALGALLRPGEE